LIVGEVFGCLPYTFLIFPLDILRLYAYIGSRHRERLPRRGREGAER
jgi:hypothetical protein